MRALLSIVGTLTLSLTALATPTFTVLTPPSGGGAAGVGVSAAISRDGSSVMVPGSWTSGVGTMLYNKTGWHLLNNLRGFSVSADGTRVIGNYQSGNNLFFWDGATYTVQGTAFGSGFLGMAANGGFGVGEAQVDLTGTLEQYATLYYAGATNYQYLNHPTGRTASFDTANACSADGTHVVGWSYTDDNNDGQIPVEWLYGSPVSLPLVSGTTNGAAVAINDAGNMLVASNGSHLVLYTNGVPQDLGLNQVVGDITASESSMSNDGNVVLFHGSAEVFPGYYVIWTPQYGFVDAYNFLVARGVNFDGYTNYNVYSVSADGTKFAGLVYSKTDKNVLLPYIATIDPLVPTAKTFTINSSIIGGNNLSGVLTLSAVSKSRFRIAVASADHLISAAPVLNANTTVEDFPVPTSGVVKATTETVDATVGGTTLGLTVQLLPASLTSMNFAAASVAGGNNILCAAHFNGNTPTTGGTISVTSSLPDIAVVNPGYYVTKNYPYTEFTIATKPVATVQTPLISITYEGVTKSETLTVEPATLSGISFKNPTVVGGNSDNLTISLDGPAPSTGVKVDLKSSNPALASVASTVSIASGGRSAALPVSTKAVTKNTMITITATYGSVVKTCTLTLGTR